VSLRIEAIALYYSNFIENWNSGASTPRRNTQYFARVRIAPRCKPESAL
jgi:hypothetical protein